MLLFWIGILIAVVFAVSSVKLGFYQAWTTLFNVLVAVYLGVRLGPVIQGFLPSGGPYGGAIAVGATAILTFLILHGISYVFLIGQFEVTFSRGINQLGSALLGFLAGLLAWSFVTLVICTTPFSQNDFVRDAGFGPKGFEQARMQSYLVWWCGAVDKLVASSDGGQDIEQTVKDLLAKPVTKTRIAVTSHSDNNTPLDVNSPADQNVPGAQAAPEPNMILPP
jgi:uncharacterized membrane protein required for colicin V production